MKQSIPVASSASGTPKFGRCGAISVTLAGVQFVAPAKNTHMNARIAIPERANELGIFPSLSKDRKVQIKMIN
ncbi:MAG: hypothetical protein AAB869_00705 [Patescibacteria group bacterium]